MRGLITVQMTPQLSQELFYNQLETSGSYIIHALNIATTSKHCTLYPEPRKYKLQIQGGWIVWVDGRYKVQWTPNPCLLHVIIQVAIPSFYQ